MIKKHTYTLILVLIFLSGGCVKEFVPTIQEEQLLIVVEGQITNQPGIFTINLSRAKPLWKKELAIPLKKCRVWIADDLGKTDTLKEIKSGVYVTDSSRFKGQSGRDYTLHLKAAAEYGGRNYQSLPMKMRPVPPVDSIYYEKRNFVNNDELIQGCQIFLDTHDPSNSCRFYRWSFDETWEFHIPFSEVINKICWISGKSKDILIKNTSSLAEDKVTRFPLYLISDPIDRLTVKYSILVNQFSLSEDEYVYWESLRNVTDEVGGLYDIVPANIPNNLFCLENPDEKVLGYFSVSSVKPKRIFIKDNFVGINHLYDNCATGTAPATGTIPYLNILVWVLYFDMGPEPWNIPFRVTTDIKECGDCRTRGVNTPPSFWK
jgi:hypothetical protein